MTDDLKAKIPQRLTGREEFKSHGVNTGFSVTSFWQWSASDLLGNAMRGLVAEYLVAHKLGCTTKPRTEWDAYDVLTDDGIEVEVKSSAYLQSWNQTHLSVLSFSVAKTQGLDGLTNIAAPTKCRQADVYVFCVLAHKDKATVDPLNLDQWQFYVISTDVLDAALGDQKTAVLDTLRRIGATEVAYEELAEKVRRAGQTQLTG